MKKIFVFSHALEIGGAERALLGLLESFDVSGYEVDLFLMRHEGELMGQIPDKVHLLPPIEEYSCLAVPIADVLKKKQFGIAMGRLTAKKKARDFLKKYAVTGDNDVELEYSHKYTLKYMPEISGTEYDLAISFLTPHYFVSEKVKAKKKIAWIHTDYSHLEVDTESEEKMWGKYDYIASISDKCTEGFLKRFPSLESKIKRIDNIILPSFIISQANSENNETQMPKNNGMTLLSVGRFSNAKNFDNVPEICKMIRETGLDIRWYLIGYGGDEELIRRKIAEAGMEDYVIILGKKENPYPYIKACDLYVQPSRYEGKAVTVREAQILHKPVVITAFETSKSQLADGFDGVIVPMDNEGCAAGIASVLRDENLRQRLIDNTKKTDYTNSDETQKIYRLVE